MSGKRAKIAATATILGLGALGGVALETNHGVPVQTAQVRSGSGAVVTSASGATVDPAGRRRQDGDDQAPDRHPRQRLRRPRVDRRLSGYRCLRELSPPP